MNGRAWTQAEFDVLRARYELELTRNIARDLGRPLGSTHQHARDLGLSKPRWLIAQWACERSARPDHGGVRTRFKPGQVPWSKGTKGVAGMHPNSRRTQFRKGHVSERWDPEAYIVGALRINADGGLDMKIRNGPYRLGDPPWVSLARWVWIRARGAIPAGMVLRARNGDAHDTRIENLYLASRRELMRENTVHNLPPDVAGVIQLRGALNRQINRRMRLEASA